MEHKVEAEVQALANSLDCLTEEQLTLLGKLQPTTTEAWRKRGKGPAYILFGCRFLYPRKAVEAYLQSIVKTRARVDVREML